MLPFSGSDSLIDSAAKQQMMAFKKHIIFPCFKTKKFCKAWLEHNGLEKSHAWNATFKVNNWNYTRNVPPDLRNNTDLNLLMQCHKQVLQNQQININKNG